MLKYIYNIKLPTRAAGACEHRLDTPACARRRRTDRFFGGGGGGHALGGGGAGGAARLALWAPLARLLAKVLVSEALSY